MLGCSYKPKPKRKETVNNTPNFYVYYMASLMHKMRNKHLCKTIEFNFNTENA